MNYNFDLDDKKPMTKKIIKEIIIWVVEILLAIVLAFLLITFAVEKTTVVGDSMETTLQNQNAIIINKAIYHISKPKRFDVIVFNQKGREHSYYNIKRIIGLPGETIQIIDGFVRINGEQIEEKVPVDLIINGGLADDAVTLDENEYFVLGDNRNNSEDSRFANIGNIVSDDIVGKAWIRIKPFNFVNQINTESVFPTNDQSTEQPEETKDTK